MQKMPELLAPAGNMERLLTALHFGADAVYVGLSNFSLRNFADNFTPETLKEACDLAHSMGKKVYVACNAFLRDEELEAAGETLRAAELAGVDAAIVNDPAIMRLSKRYAPNLCLHLSTQANTLNRESALFWHEQGVKRIVLARELSLDEIKKMREALPESLELEIFVHGAMCISFSGRCLLSNYLSGRDANRGECVQPCRWSYELREKGTDGEYFPVVQEERGTFFLNSKDMNLLPLLPEVIESGACSLKVEGRMKSIFYVATVVNAWRMAIDHYAACLENNVPYELPAAIAEELEKCSHRPYTVGFANGHHGVGEQAPEKGGSIHTYDLVAVVTAYDPENHIATLEQRNRFYEGDRLEILAPSDIERTLVVTELRDEEGNRIECSPHPKQITTIRSEEPLTAGDMLRKRV
ncbi:MAG: U32 family peptidase [Clostridia bacterium]|nr:U32 family peptidase [Clostridia bacterium]